MKPNELMWLYESGERNFRGVDLRGQSLRGKNLSDVDLTKADLRGADFSGANLKNVIFSGAKLGLQPHYALVMGISLVIVAALVGSVAGLVDTVAELQFHSSNLVQLIPKWFTLGVLLGFAGVALNRGIAASFMVFILAFIVAGMIAIASSAAVIAAGAIAIAITLASFVAVAISIMVVITTAATLVLGPLMAVITAVAFGLPFLLIAVPSAGESAIGLTVTVILLSFIITWQALRGSRKHAPIVAIASSIVNRWGTSFRGADLTNANFTYTRLDNADFDDAILTCVCWDDRGRPDAVMASFMSNQ